MVRAFLLSLGFAAQLAHASGAGAVTVNNKNVLIHVLESKALASVVTAHPILKELEFRSVTVERDFSTGVRQFALSLEYEHYPTRANCTVEAYVNVRAPGATVELPAPTFSEVSCDE